MAPAGLGFFFTDPEATSQLSDEEDEEEEEYWGSESEGNSRGAGPVLSPRLVEKLQQVEAEDLSTVLKRLDSIRQLAGDAQVLRQRESKEQTARQLAVDQLYSLLLEEAGFQPQAVMQRGLLAVLEGIRQLGADIYFFSAEEARRGLDSGPSLQLREGSLPRRYAERLQVTPEVLDCMLAELQTPQIRDLVGKVGEYLMFKQTSYQVRAVEEKDGALVKNATGLAVFKTWTLVTDALSHCLWKVSTNSFNDEGNHRVEPFAGLADSPGLQDGHLQQARFRSPMGIVVCEDIGIAFVADTDNHAIRRIDFQAEVVSTLDLSPTPFVKTLLCADFVRPKGICAIRGDPAVLASMDYRQKKVCDEVQVEIEKLTIQRDCGCADNSEDSSGFGGSSSSSSCSCASRSTSSSSSGTASSSPSNASGMAARGAVPRRLAALREEQMSLEQSLSVAQIKKYPVLQDMEAPDDSRPVGPDAALAESHDAVDDVFLKGAATRRQSVAASLPSPQPEEPLEQSALRLAVTADHCVWLVDPATGQAQIIAGDPVQYGYCDAPLGLDARFSSPKGVINVRSALFVADYWNNVVRCVNLYTSQVDTVMDFKPQGPVAMSLSHSGVLYLLDSEGIHHANILGIMSTQCGDAPSTVGASAGPKSEYQTLFPNPRTRSRSSSVYSDSTLVHSEIWDAVRRKSCQRGESASVVEGTGAAQVEPLLGGAVSKCSLTGDFHSRLEAHLQKAAEDLEDGLRRKRNRRLKAHARKNARRQSELGDEKGEGAAPGDGLGRRLSFKGPLASPCPLPQEPESEPMPRTLAQGCRGRMTLTRSLHPAPQMPLQAKRCSRPLESVELGRTQDDDGGARDEARQLNPLPMLLPVPAPRAVVIAWDPPKQTSGPTLAPRITVTTPTNDPGECADELTRRLSQANVDASLPGGPFGALRIMVTPSSEDTGHYVDEVKRRLSTMGSRRASVSGFDTMPLTLNDLGVESKYSQRGSLAGGPEAQYGHRGSLTSGMRRPMSELAQDSGIGGSMAVATAGMDKDRYLVIQESARRSSSSLAADAGTVMVCGGRALYRGANELWSDKKLAPEQAGLPSSRRASMVDGSTSSPWGRLAKTIGEDEDGNPVCFVDLTVQMSRRGSFADHSRRSSFQAGPLDRYLDGSRRASSVGGGGDWEARQQSFVAELPLPGGLGSNAARRRSSMGGLDELVPPQFGVLQTACLEKRFSLGPLGGVAKLGVAALNATALGTVLGGAAPSSSALLGAERRASLGVDRRASLGADRRSSLGVLEQHRGSLSAASAGVGNRRASVSSRRGSVMIMPTVVDNGDQEEEDEEDIQDDAPRKWTVPAMVLKEESDSDEDAEGSDEASELWVPGKSDGPSGSVEERRPESSEGNSELWVDEAQASGCGGSMNGRASNVADGRHGHSGRSASDPSTSRAVAHAWKDSRASGERSGEGAVATHSPEKPARSCSDPSSGCGRQSASETISARWPEDQGSGKCTLFSRMLGEPSEEDCPEASMLSTPSEMSSSGIVSLSSLPFTRDIDVDALSPTSSGDGGASFDVAAFPDLASSSALRRRTTTATSVAAGHGYKVAEQKTSNTWRAVLLPEPLSAIAHGGKARKYPNTPLSLACLEGPFGSFLLVGLVFAPTLLKVVPPKHHEPDVGGRFNALPIDSRRFLLADSTSHQIWLVNCATRTRAHVAGCGKRGYLDGPLGTCRMHSPCSLALDPHTHHVYVADKGNHAIRKLDLQSGLASTVAGGGCRGSRDGSDRRCQALDSPFEVSFAAPHHLVISCADNAVRSLDLRTGHLATLLIGA